MPRELRHEWIEKKEKEFQLDQQEWRELKREFSYLQAQAQNTEQKLLLIQSKIVKFFDILTQKLEKQDVKREELRHFVEDQIHNLSLKMEKTRKGQESVFFHKLQNIIEETHKLHRENSFQIKDLCQNLSSQLELIWNLKDQLEEVKKSGNVEKSR